MRELKATRAEMTGEELIYGQSTFPVSFSFIVAAVLLLTAMVAAVNIIFHFGPFS
jgi:putative membrane protein